MYFFVILGRHVKNDERMNPIDFGGQTKLLCISLSNFADMLTMVTLLIWRSQFKGEGHHGYHWQIWGARGCYALRCYILEILDCSADFSRRQKLFQTREHFQANTCRFFYRENMTSFLNYITAMLRALFAWRSSFSLYRVKVWRMNLQN